MTFGQQLKWNISKILRNVSFTSATTFRDHFNLKRSVIIYSRRHSRSQPPDGDNITRFQTGYQCHKLEVNPVLLV